MLLLVSTSFITQDFTRPLTQLVLKILTFLIIFSTLDAPMFNLKTRAWERKSAKKKAIKNKTNYLWIHKSKLQGCINSRRYFFLWQIMAGMFLFLLIITTKVQAELFGFHFQIKDGTSFSKENTLWTGKTGSIMSCSHLCTRREACKIAMFWVNQRTCSLLDTAQREEGQKRPQQDDVFYLQKVW